MRIIFIPGFAEDELIFSKITPFITGDKLVLNSWKLLGDQPREGFNVLKFAQEFIERYKVTDHDILIGHSMGGWIAYHVKHLIGCRIIHVASMTNTDRIIPPAVDHAVVYWLARKGLVFNAFTTWLASFGFYHHSYSKEIFMYYAHLLQNGNKGNIVNQLKTILKPVNTVITIQPDLRIHGKQDNILKPPAEPFYQVPGDHFTLYTHPKEVATPIVDFLRSI